MARSWSALHTREYSCVPRAICCCSMWAAADLLTGVHGISSFASSWPLPPSHHGHHAAEGISAPPLMAFASVSCGAICRCPGGAKSSKCTTPGTSCWHEAQNSLKLCFARACSAVQTGQCITLIHQQHSITFKEKYRPYNSRSLHCEFVSLERNAWLSCIACWYNVASDDDIFRAII